MGRRISYETLPKKRNGMKKLLVFTGVVAVLAALYILYSWRATFAETAILTVRQLVCQYRCEHHTWPRNQSDIVSMAEPAELSIINAAILHENMKLSAVSVTPSSFN